MKKRILSIILVLAIFIGAFPLEALAAAKDTIVDTFFTETDVVSEKNVQQEVIVIGEDESRRDETTKHYILSNGNRKAVKYSQPVHYKNNGKWVDIDNTLEYDETTNEYTNKANSFKVNFNKNSGSEKLFAIENSGYTMSWKYKSNSSNRSAVNGKPQANKSENLNGFEKYTEKVNSKIKYEGFEDKSTLEYVVTATGVKENIILQSADCKNEFTFEVKADGLTLTKNEDGSITFTSKETNEVVFYIPAPFMYDANGEESYDVEYKIDAKNKKYILTLVADRTWLDDVNRAYPVTVDPVVLTRQEKSTIASTFVCSGQPSKNFGSVGDAYIGIESANYKICRSLFKIALPALNKGDMVVGAYMGIYVHDNSFYTTSMPDKQINAHAITKSWNETSVTWNSNVTYDSVVLDYNYIKRSETSGSLWLKQFDITRTVKGWYEGTSTNYGIMIKAAAETGSNADVAARSCFWTEDQKGVASYYPYIAIEYRNNKGLEDYWSYSSYSIDSAGVAHVNDYTGNLVYVMPILSSSGEIMPLSLSGVFNNYCANVKLNVGKNKSSRTTLGKGFKLNIQETVLPSSQYGLTGSSATTYPYVYTDGDGTEHYFQKTTENGTTVYKDEDGLGLTLEVGGVCTYRIKDKADNYKYFNAKGNLFRVIDAYGNDIHIYFKAADTANGLEAISRISHIVDGSGHKYTFTYYIVNGVESDYVKTITDDAGRVTTFTTRDGFLRGVTYSDGTQTRIIYETEDATTEEVEEAAEGLINYVTANDGYTINFDYTSKATGRRVKKVKEWTVPSDNISEQGQIVTFDRTEYSTTIIRSAGLDGIHNTEDANCGADDIITVLQFDNAGRTISQQLRYGNGEEIGAGAYSYTSASDDTSALGSKNKVATSASLGKNTYNLLIGGNGEDASLWEGSISDTVTGTKTAVSTHKYMGAKSLEIKNTALTTNGVNYFRQKTNNVAVGKKYTLSAYVKITAIESVEGIISPNDYKGAYIQISAYDSSGTAIQSVRSEFLTETTDTGINNGFRRLSTTIEAPENTAQLRVYMAIRDMTGAAYFDCIQLEEGELASTYNMLENASFETASGGLPTKWTVKNITYSVSDSTVKQGVSSAGKKHGTSSMRVTGSTGSNKYIYQRVPVEANDNDTYIVSGWANAHAVSDVLHSSYFDICPEVMYTKTDANGETTTVKQKKPAAKFNTAIKGWQYTATSFSLAYTGAESGCTYTPELITVIIRYYYQANRAYFDHIMLCKEPASTYTYDKKGNVVSVAANGEQSTNSVYDDNNDLVSYTDTLGNKTTMTYNDYHQLLRSKSPRGVYTANGYNANGTYKASELRNKETTSTSTVVVRTHQNYYADDTSTAVKENAYVKSVYDEHGRAAATYAYDYASGAVTSVTDAKGTVTTNTYNDDFTLLTAVQTGNSKVSYTYKEGSSIVTSILFGSAAKNEQYGFEYDNFGRVTATKVGNTALATNTYAQKNGPLTLTTYGNGDTISYRYNRLGLVDQTVRTDGDNTRTFNWAYSSAG
ncbi:MAG: DNRLRE domain-containing protein, partial [Acutalibacteraceae bacterium]|nr:DNRLRE domain-containing protein [Acutalibacteraceae bacterium]